MILGSGFESDREGSSYIGAPWWNLRRSRYWVGEEYCSRQLVKSISGGLGFSSGIEGRKPWNVRMVKASSWSASFTTSSISYGSLVTTRYELSRRTKGTSSPSYRADAWSPHRAAGTPFCERVVASIAADSTPELSMSRIPGLEENIITTG